MGIERDILEKAIMPAMAVLPPRMNTPSAIAMLLAIGLQESNLTARRQHGNGPARGLWQFERGGGVRGVLSHKASAGLVTAVCVSRGIADDERALYDALEHDDVLAAAIARLLLWTDSRALPSLSDCEKGFEIYIDVWRPGAYSRGSESDRTKLRRKWAANWAAAVREVKS